MLFTASFDDQSMKTISAFAGLPIFLTEEVQQAEQELGALIITKTRENALARFAQNSPGGLAESFVMIPESPFEVSVGSNAPHAHRRDQGFGIGGTEATDSLGRTYHDKPYLYFSDAITEVKTSGEGMGILQAGVERALARMGG